LRIDLDSVPGEVEIRLTDMHGRQVAAWKNRTGSVDADLSGLTPGIYIVSVVSGNTRGHQRLIVAGR
jgi:hypothetical protein